MYFIACTAKPKNQKKLKGINSAKVTLEITKTYQKHRPIYKNY